MRSFDRGVDELRQVTIATDFTRYAEGSVLIAEGDTKVLCNASVIEGVPPFLKNSGKGWVTAEYALLPRATMTRTEREAAKGKQTGRTQEIQRLIGRSLRQAVDLEALDGLTIQIDCDVLQADGGTRCAAITGGWVALAIAINKLVSENRVPSTALRRQIAAVSAGVVEGVPLLDLDYAEDSTSEVDMNFVMTDEDTFVEIQGTAEGKPFAKSTFDALASLAQKGTRELMLAQKKALQTRGE